MKEAMEQVRQKLMESIFEVFEKMLYVFLEPAEAPGTAFDMEAQIAYQGSRVKGTFHLWLSRELAGKMAENLMGIDSADVSEKCAADCAKEAVNMICGNFLSKFDKTQTFNLSIPVVNTPPVPGIQGLCRLDFDSDSGKIGVVMRMSKL